MHSAQTRMCFLAPFTSARTRRRFGFQRRRRVLFAWLITFPKCGILPHNSHFIAILFLQSRSKNVQSRAIHSTRPSAVLPTFAVFAVGQLPITHQGLAQPDSEPVNMAAR